MPGIPTDELREATVYATTNWKSLGPRLEVTKVREIYYIGLLNRAAAGTRVVIAELASGGTPSPKDIWGLVLDDEIAWPDSLSQLSVPYMTLKTDTASVKYLRVSAAASSVWCRILYRDVP